MQDHPFRNVCDLRQGSKTSLIELEFTTHTAEEAAQNPGVPQGMPYSSLTASMHSLEVVFLSRFLFEVLRYVSLLLALRPEPLEAPQLNQPPPKEPAAEQKPPSDKVPAPSPFPRLALLVPDLDSRFSAATKMTCLHQPQGSSSFIPARPRQHAVESSGFC